MHSAERAFTWFLLLFFSLLFAATWQYDARARLAPLLLVVPAIILSAVHLWIIYRHPRLQEEAAEGGGEESFEIDAPFSEERKMIGWFIFFAVLIWLVGFLVATPVFLLIFLRLWAKERWPLTIAIAGISTVVIYLLVEVAFRVILYRGWIFSQ
ncbi:MAG: tripartite tricarboxylate transporter TctB family protein [Deltaproteobacteria bacterium]|nr:tripartite tricarboxylate transporter TctB family protein [Deltaproteobacteria bacterium]